MACLIIGGAAFELYHSFIQKRRDGCLLMNQRRKLTTTRALPLNESAPSLEFGKAREKGGWFTYYVKTAGYIDRDLAYCVVEQADDLSPQVDGVS